MLSPVRRLHDHQRSCGRIHKMPHPTQLDPLEVAHSQADQIGAVILPFARRRQTGALDLERRTPQCRRGIAISDPLESRNQLAALQLRLGHWAHDTLTACETQNPTAVVEQAFRRIGVGLDVDPPLDPERGADPA